MDEFDHRERAVLTARGELGAFIRAQEGRIGDVYRLEQEHLSDREIADRLNVETSGFVGQYRGQIRAALDGTVPTSPTVLRGTISALRGLLKRGRSELSDTAFDLLQAHLGLLEAASAAVTPEAEADAEVEAGHAEDVELRKLRGVPGIYAFSYGWYLERPLDPEGGSTLIKVGKAEDVARRIEQHRHGARAHIPEPLVVIRVYAVGDRDLSRTEEDFHRLASTAGHTNPRRQESLHRSRNEVGTEWFLTNRAFLDAIATALGLRTLYAA